MGGVKINYTTGYLNTVAQFSVIWYNTILFF